MKVKFSLYKRLIILGALLFPVNLLAQNEVGGLFKSGPADATKLFDAYFTPVYKGFGVGLNSGWANSAKTKGFLRFELRATVATAFTPDEDRSYNTNSLGLTGIKPASGPDGIGPTASGENDPGSLMEIYAGNTPTGETFNLPKGTGLKFVPSPQIQLTVGLPKNIDLSLRLIPGVKLGSDYGKVNQFGLGAKFEILPLIMGKTEKLVPVDLALALGFTSTKYTLDLDINNGKYNNQQVEVKFNGFSAEAIVSKQILFFTPFASVGYNSSNSEGHAYGTYDFQTSAGPQTFTDPINIKHDDLSGMKASLGFQLNLAIFRVYGSYTMAAYNFANFGIGFGLGK